MSWSAAQPQSGVPNPRVSLPRQGGDVRSKNCFLGGRGEPKQRYAITSPTTHRKAKGEVVEGNLVSKATQAEDQTGSTALHIASGRGNLAFFWLALGTFLFFFFFFFGGGVLVETAIRGINVKLFGGVQKSAKEMWRLPDSSSSPGPTFTSSTIMVTHQFLSS